MTSVSFPCVPAVVAAGPPFGVLCHVLPELLSGWIIFKIARLSRVSLAEIHATLRSTHEALSELLALVDYLEHVPLQFPGFGPMDELRFRAYPLFHWDPPDHRALGEQAVQFMENSFNYYVGKGNDLSAWDTARENHVGQSPLNIFRRINQKLDGQVGWAKAMGMLADGGADFLYTPLVEDADLEWEVGPVHCAGPGLLIIARHKSLFMVFCARYTKTTYMIRVFWPWIASVTA